MSKTTIRLPFDDKPIEWFFCDAKITDAYCHCLPTCIEEGGKTILKQKFYGFNIDGKELHICEDCFRLWQTEPERIFI